MKKHKMVIEDLEEDLDKLYDLEIKELDNIVSIADNMATELAQHYTGKLKRIGSKNIELISNKRKQMLKDFSNKKRILTRYIQSAPFTRLSDKITFIYGVLSTVI